MKNPGDCGCGGYSLELDAAAVEASGGEPDLEALEQALAELASETEDVSFDVAGLEGALDAAEADLAFAIDDADLPPLGSVLAIAERYPGLKITFSF